jgi:opacity protein-like surface antigen
MYRSSSVLAIGFLAVASPSLADNPGGFYLGAGYGDFSTRIDSIDDVDISFRADDDAFKIFAGWRFNPVIALELNYIDFGSASATEDVLAITAETKAIAPYVIGTLPIGPLELFAKAGLVFYDAEVRTSFDAQIDESGRDFAYGAGIGATVLDRLNLRLEYEVIDISEFRDARGFWVSASWRF